MHKLKCLLFFWLSFQSYGAMCTDTLMINSAFTPPVSTILEQIISEACKRLNVKLEFHELTGERALVLANQGEADGECCRIPEIVLREYQNLMQVPEGVFVVNFSAFTRRPDIKIHGWNDLKPHSVGTVTGWKILVQNMQTISPAQSIVLDTPDSLFRMLDMGRIDVGLYGELSGLDVIQRLNLKYINIQQPPLASHTLYLMLNKRHQALAPKFAAVFKSMKKDGTSNRIINKVMGKTRPD